MQAMQLLLDDTPSDWGASLKMLVSLLVMLIVLIAAFVWWAKRG
jgi:Tfp pilus assembly protein PilO